jgi:two-component system, cell cycle sensor histidine kinase and response regulator CckA
VSEQSPTRRPWLLTPTSFPEALARIRRDGLVLETFLPTGVGPVPPEERWDGRTLDDILGVEVAAPWLERIRAALERGSVASARLHWARPGSPLVFEVRLVPCGPDAALAIAREVGYQERLEADRDAMHALLQRATDLLPDLVYVFDHAEQRSLFQNRSIGEELGYPPEQIARFGDNPLPQLVHPEDLSMLPEILGRLMSASDGDVMSYEGRWRAADGSWRWYLTNSRVFARGPDGTPTQVFGMMRNVTELRELEQRLHRAAKVDALGTVAGSVAHDFNNALTAIRGYAELLEGQVSEAGRADLAELRAAIDGAKSLTSRVLGFSRSGHHRLEPLDLAALLRQIEPLLERMLGAGIALELVLGAEPAVVRADPRELEQVLVNLALNAREAMPKGGSFRITLEQDASDRGASFSEESGRWVRLRVSDTGEGMTGEILGRAFEPFFTTKTTGTGLGLASARLAIEHAGGTLEAESEPGVGTRFLARLPCCATPPLAPAEGERPATRASGRVLVVDDEPMVLRLIVATLERSGHRVLAAADPEAALRIAADAAEPIDLLISDVVMPALSGPELASRIRKLQPGLPVLFVSGFHDQAQLDGAGPGASALLHKPFSPRQLGEVTARMLSSRASDAD